MADAVLVLRSADDGSAEAPVDQPASEEPSLDELDRHQGATDPINEAVAFDYSGAFMTLPESNLIIAPFGRDPTGLKLHLGTQLLETYKSYILLKGTTKVQPSASDLKTKDVTFLIKIGARAKPEVAVHKITSTMQISTTSITADWHNLESQDTLEENAAKSPESEKTDLPDHIKNAPKVAGYATGGNLYKVSIKFDLQGVMTENLFHSRDLVAHEPVAEVRNIFAPVANATRKEIHLYVFAGPRFPSLIHRVKEPLAAEMLQDPVGLWHANPNKQYVQLGQELPPDKRPSQQMPAIRTFESFEEYQTLQAYAVIQEKESVAKLIDGFRHIEKGIKIMNFPGAEGRFYIAFMLAFEMEDIPKLQPRSQVKIYMEKNNLALEDAWTATVLEPLPFTEIGAIAMQLHRPRKKKDPDTEETIDPEDAFVDLEVEAGPFTFAVDEDAAKAYQDFPVRQVRVEIISSDKSLRQQLAGMGKIRNTLLRGPALEAEALWTNEEPAVNKEDSSAKEETAVKAETGKKPVTADQVKNLKHWSSLLLGQSTAVTVTSDLYEAIKDTDIPLKSGLMTPSQCEVAEYVRKIPNKIGIIQGPPGTGKTTTAIELLLPLLKGTKDQVLMVAPANVTVDDFILKLTKRLHDVGQGESHMIVRMHAAFADHELVRKEGNIPAQEKAARLNTVKAEEEIGQLLTARFIYEHVRASTVTSHISDPRLKLAEHSLGMMMLKVTGIVKSPWKSGRDTQWDSLHNAIFNLQHSAEFEPDPTNNANIRESMNEAKTIIFQNARVIATTVSGMCDGWLVDFAKVDWIVVDEYSRASEPVYATMMAHYPNVKGILCFGDHRQLRPVAIAKAADNNLYAQLLLSLPARLLQLGHQAVLLTEQHRMVQGTAEFTSSTFYDGKLSYGANTAMSGRPNAQEMCAFLKKNYLTQVREPRVFFDVLHGQRVEGAGHTSFNLENAGFVVKLIDSILQTTNITANNICVLTPYQGQFEVYKNAFRASTTSQNKGGLMIRKADGFQGGESSVIILDLVFSKRPGFMTEANRINVATSRHRDCLLVVGAMAAVERNDAWDGGTLKKLASSFLRTGHVVPISDESLVNIPAIKTTANYLPQNAQAPVGRAKTMNCHRCQQSGHKAADCSAPETCKTCGKPDHTARDCPDGLRAMTCHRCQQSGHKAADCSVPETCNNCGKVGHRAQGCPDEDSCAGCNDRGHNVFNCPSRPKRRRLTPVVDNAVAMEGWAAGSENTADQPS
ncbi:MAG: hypothetical protein M4579_006528 [Chaenotheca gracillima]|nr:MAG: hypothetical protein M4579_006528 [Chaenotheca gracillima]